MSARPPGADKQAWAGPLRHTPPTMIRPPASLVLTDYPFRCLPPACLAASRAKSRWPTDVHLARLHGPRPSMQIGAPEVCMCITLYTALASTQQQTSPFSLTSIHHFAGAPVAALPSPRRRPRPRHPRRRNRLGLAPLIRHFPPPRRRDAARHAIMALMARPHHYPQHRRRRHSHHV